MTDLEKELLRALRLAYSCLDPYTNKAIYESLGNTLARAALAERGKSHG